jgi:RNA polymerase sigma-70 factor (ECF subfamily)
LKARVVPIRLSARGATEWSDEAVAAACSSGDPEAVAELFDRFHRSVTRFLSRVVASRSDVEDLAQSTFLQVARGQARFDQRSAVQTWLFGIAANVVRHHLRATVRRRNLSHALSLTRSGVSHEPLSGAADARRALERVRATLYSLPESRRLAFVLCEIEGLSAAEAATVLGTSETAVWKRVSEARKALLRVWEGTV